MLNESTASTWRVCVMLLMTMVLCGCARSEYDTGPPLTFENSPGIHDDLKDVLEIKLGLTKRELLNKRPHLLAGSLLGTLLESEEELSDPESIDAAKVLHKSTDILGGSVRDLEEYSFKPSGDRLNSCSHKLCFTEFEPALSVYRSLLEVYHANQYAIESISIRELDVTDTMKWKVPMVTLNRGGNHVCLQLERNKNSKSMMSHKGFVGLVQCGDSAWKKIPGPPKVLSEAEVKGIFEDYGLGDVYAKYGPNPMR